MKKKVFRSRFSVALNAPILAFMLWRLILMICSGNIFNAEFYILIGFIAFIVLLFCGIRYEIVGDKLRIGTWIVGNTYPISQIISVERSYNPLSAPAGSLKRLCVHFGKRSKWPIALISPVREQEFLNTLKKINPNIYIRVPNKKGWWRF